MPSRLTTSRSALLLIGLSCAGCAGMNHAQQGALVGTSLGALAGGVIGHQSGNAGAGAVLGGAAGMLAGTLVGDAEDAREERDWAIRQASYERSLAPPLTNADLIYMAQNGLSEEVILEAVRSRGGRFDIAPTALVQLKQSGVSDAVIAEVQRHGGRILAPAPPGAARVIYVDPYYPPPPRVHYSFGVGSSCYGPSWHHCHHW